MLYTSKYSIHMYTVHPDVYQKVVCTPKQNYVKHKKLLSFLKSLWSVITQCHSINFQAFDTLHTFNIHTWLRLYLTKACKNQLSGVFHANITLRSKQTLECKVHRKYPPHIRTITCHTACDRTANKEDLCQMPNSRNAIFQILSI